MDAASGTVMHNLFPSITLEWRGAAAPPPPLLLLPGLLPFGFLPIGPLLSYFGLLEGLLPVTTSIT